MSKEQLSAYPHICEYQGLELLQYGFLHKSLNFLFLFKFIHDIILLQVTNHSINLKLIGSPNVVT